MNGVDYTLLCRFGRTSDVPKRICWNNYTPLYVLTSDDYASLYGFIRNTIRHYAEQGVETIRHYAERGVETIRHHAENESIMQHYAE